MPPAGGNRAFSNSMPSECHILNVWANTVPLVSVYTTCQRPTIVGCQFVSSWFCIHGIAGDGTDLSDSPQAFALFTPVNNPAINRVRTTARRDARVLDGTYF